MLPVADLTAYLVAHGITAPVVPGPWIPDDLGDRLVVLTPTGGLGSTNDDLFDVHTVQARVRGAQRDYADAEALAGQVDGVFTDFRPPLLIGGRAVRWMGRLAGPPAAFPRDTGGRHQFVCAYQLHTTR